MTATLTDPRPSVPMTASSGRLRERLAGLERPLLLAGLALVALHLLDLAFSGPDTMVLGVLGIVAVPAAWALARPHVTRPTRLVLGVVIGLLTFGFGVISHGLHVVNSGPDWTDVTGVGMIAGGVLLVASGLAAIAAPRRAPRRPALGWRLAHGAGWMAAVPVVALFVVMPFTQVLRVTHAPRWAIQEASLGIPHQEVALATTDGRELSAWYVPSRNRTAVLLSHGSGGSRERVAAHVRMLARHGYGVLALDNPGNGESDGHSNGLGYNAQPAVDAALRWLSRRPDVDPQRIAGFGSSLGAEVLLEAAAREARLCAVVADGPTRPMDGHRVSDPAAPERAFGAVWLQAVRGVSGMREAPSLIGLVPRIAPRPVLLIAGGVSAPDEIPRQPGLPRRRRPHHAALGAPGRRPHRRAARTPRRIRAPDHRLPRPGSRAQGDLMTFLRHALLVGVPLAFSVLLWFHPMISDYDGLRDVTARFQIVHVAMVLVLPLPAAGMYLLLDGLRGRAATVGRLALIPFVAFYVPYVAFEGIALGVLGQELNGLPPAERAAVAPGLVEDFARNPILGEPGVFWALGSTAWMTVVVAAVLAFRRAGAPLALQILLGTSVLIGAHAPPLAPIGLVCFAAAGGMVLRARHAEVAKPVAPAVA